MKKLILSTIFALAIACAIPAHAQSVAGQWNIHNDIGGSESDMKCTFTQTDKNLAATCKSDSGEIKITGTVDGKKMTFKYNTDYNGQTLTLVYNATVDDPAKIAGTVEVQPMDVTGDFTMTPAKEAAK